MGLEPGLGFLLPSNIIERDRQFLFLYLKNSFRYGNRYFVLNLDIESVER